MLPMELAQLLAHSDAFSMLDDPTRERIAASLIIREFPSGAMLAGQGEPGGALFLIVTGSVAVEKLSPTRGVIRVGTYGAGSVLGELGLVTGYLRAASITATEPTTAALLEPMDFTRLCAEFPEQLGPFVQWMTERLHRTQIHSAIEETPLFHKLTPTTRENFIKSLSWMELQTGETVFTEGERGDALYLIVSGRIRLTKSADGAVRELAELGKGDLVGEMALLTQQPRSATARAARDTQLARLERSAFQNLLESSPQEWLAFFTEELSERLRVSNSPKGSDRRQFRPPASIVVLPLAASAGSFGKELVAALSVFGPTLHLTRTGVGQMFSQSLSSATAVESRLMSWLNEQETQHRHLVFEADMAATSDDGWNARAFRQADLILVAADASQSTEAVAREVKRVLGSSAALAPSLVLMHEPTAPHAVKTAEWRAAIGAARHFHVRTGNSNDVGRIARSINHKSVGLVLGGGFALGLGHIGVVQAIRDLSIPVDYVAGTSMGAILAAACAIDFTRDQMMDVMHKGCADSLKGDFTLPVVSLLTGKKVMGQLGAYLAGVDIEDFWLPFFCISTSLANARMIVHEKGDALRSVLATCRVPALFPPIGWDGDVLVDGGLVNNVPNDVMRKRIGPGTLISVDVSTGDEFTMADAFDLHLSGWKLLRDAMWPFPRKKVPSVLKILFRLIGLGGVEQKQRIKDYADVYLTPPAGNYSFRDFSHGEEMAQSAYPYAQKMLEDWMEKNGRPWAGSAAH